MAKMNVQAFYGNAIEDESGCWIWQSKPNNSGYGVTHYNKKTIGAHVMSWMIANKSEVPQGLKVLHTCDVRNCINPEHLFVGTQKENMQDAARKGRTGNRKLKAVDVESIKLILGIGVQHKTTVEILSERYGVTKSNISMIEHGKRWNWLGK